MLDSLSTQTVKNQILDAASTIVARKGAVHLTFDALVTETGMSKGGILYHFRNKEALLQAMVDRMIDRFETHRDRIKEKETDAALPNAMTYILASHTKDAEEYQSDLGVLAAAANNPTLLEPLREHYRRNFNVARVDKTHVGLDTLLHLAMDGFWLLSALGLNFSTPSQTKAMLKTAIALAKYGHFNQQEET
jgi:AcrR family transcriptional regulator